MGKVKLLMLAFLCCNFRYSEVSDYPFWNPPNSIFDTKAQIGHFTQVCEVNSLKPGRFQETKNSSVSYRYAGSATSRLHHYD